MRLHAKSLNKTKLVLLVGALAAFSLNAVVNQDPTTLQDSGEAQDVFALQNPEKSQDLNAFLPAPSRLATLFEHAPEIPPRDENFGKIFDAAVLRAQDGAFRPTLGQTLAVSDPSVLFLLTENTSGSISVGTGTIVKGDQGVNRILTAAHVLKPEDGSMPVRTIAFDGDGRALAEIAPVLMVFDESYHGGSVHASVALNDIAVGTPVSFFSEKARDTWSERGVGISADQPAHPLFVSVRRGDTTMNAGMSGAALRNELGEIVGVFSHGTNVVGEYVDTGSSRFLMNMYDRDETYRFADQIQMMMTHRAFLKKDGNAFGIAAPVIHPEILAALGVDDVKENPSLEAFEAQIAGFPDMEGVTGNTYVTPMTDYDARAFMRDQFVFEFDVETDASPQLR